MNEAWAFWASRVYFEYFMQVASGNVHQLREGGEIAFRPPATAAQIISKSLLFILLLNVVRQTGTTADASTWLKQKRRAPLAQNPFVVCLC